MATVGDDNPYRSALAEVARPPRRWSWQRVFRVGMMCLAGYFAMGSAFAVIATIIDLVLGGTVTKLSAWGALGLLVAATFQVFAYASAMRCWRTQRDRIGTAYFALGSFPCIAAYVVSYFIS